MKINHFIGIDISKNKLDLAVLSEGVLIFHEVIPNSENDIQKFIVELKSLKGYSIKKAIFCMENTGVYGNFLLRQLLKKKAQIVVENAVHIKRSMGLVRDKNDKKDAQRIALFAWKNQQFLKFWEPPRPVIIKLQHLAEVRERLVGIGVSLQLPLKENGIFLDSSLNKLRSQHTVLSITAVKTDIKRVEEAIHQTIQQDSRLARLTQLITSVPGVGKHTALHLLIRTNEFKSIVDPKKFACYSGVVPFKIESGLTTSKARISKYANKKMKSLLHICAWWAIRVDPEIKQYYIRKTEIDKKAKLSVINAVRNKLILRIFACVGQDRVFVVKE